MTGKKTKFGSMANREKKLSRWQIEKHSKFLWQIRNFLTLATIQQRPKGLSHPLAALAPHTACFGVPRLYVHYIGTGLATSPWTDNMTRINFKTIVSRIIDITRAEKRISQGLATFALWLWRLLFMFPSNCQAALDHRADRIDDADDTRSELLTLYFSYTLSRFSFHQLSA